MADQLDDIPGLRSVGAVGSVERARVTIGADPPDVVVLDHELLRTDGAVAIGQLRAVCPAVKVVVLTAAICQNAADVAQAMGASALVARVEGIDRVVSAVRAAATDTNGHQLVDPPRNNPSAGLLTEREQEVLALVAAGLTNSAIAERLFLSVHTVRNHIANLSIKLGAHSKLEALTIGLSLGLVANR